MKVIRSFAIGVLLLFAALVLGAVLFPLGILTTIFVIVVMTIEGLYLLRKYGVSEGKGRTVIGGGFVKLGTYLAKITKISAEAIDLVGNVVCRDLLNATMITSDGYKFGVRKEYVSSVMGKNLGNNFERRFATIKIRRRTFDIFRKERAGESTLTKMGIILVNILDTLDEDHCRKSVQDFISK